MCTSAMRTKILELEISAPMQDQTLEIHLKNVSEMGRVNALNALHDSASYSAGGV